MFFTGKGGYKNTRFLQPVYKIHQQVFEEKSKNLHWMEFRTGTHKSSGFQDPIGKAFPLL